MTNSQPHSDRPTAKQLRYIKDLWMQAGETGTLPRTRAQASAEIRRLKARGRLSPAERRREALEARREAGERHGDAAAIQPFEISGRGSHATWR
jgi:hypothetical protein